MLFDGLTLATGPHTAAWFLPFVTPLALWVALSDMRAMRIPNKTVLLTLLVYAVIGLIALPLDAYLWRYLHFAVVLAIGFVLTSTGMIGGGDAKFAAAMAPFIARDDLRFMLVLFTGCLIAALITHRGARAIPAVRAALPSWQSWTHKDFPMGLALGTSLIFYLLAALLQSAPA